MTAARLEESRKVHGQAAERLSRGIGVGVWGGLVSSLQEVFGPTGPSLLRSVL